MQNRNNPKAQHKMYIHKRATVSFHRRDIASDSLYELFYSVVTQWVNGSEKKLSKLYIMRGVESLETTCEGADYFFD